MAICTGNSGIGRLLAALIMLLAVEATQPASGKDKRKWDVEGTLVGKAKTEDMSGIACATETGFPRTCVVIDDELQAAQIVTLRNREIDTEGERLIPLIDDRFMNAPVELDGEGVAFADGNFYVIGSHGQPRKNSKKDPAKEDARIAARLAAASKLIRLRYDPATGAITPDPAGPSLALRRLIDADPELSPVEKYKNTPLEDGGITVEGIAVLGQRMFVGFRGPVLGDGDDTKAKDKHAVIVSAALGYFFEGEPAMAKRHELKLGDGRGVRDLAPYDNGLFILAGPVSSDRGTYSIYWWDGHSSEAKHLEDLPDYFDKKDKKKKEQWKPEALLPLDRNDDGVRVLLLLDSAKEGKPREIRVSYP